MTIIILALLGLALGSFINALVWRLRQQETANSKKEATRYSITKGRSQCVYCGHQLSAADLVPVLSWLMLGGKCRYCKKPILWQYPLVELATAGLFILSYIFWPQPLGGAETVDFVVWLALITGLIALAVYDLRWMLLPNRIIFPLIYLISLSALVQAYLDFSPGPVISAVSGALVGGGLFYGIFQLSRGRWIGGGDVKLGFLLGAAVGGVWPALLMLFVASVLGSIVSVPLLASGKVGRSSRIPFGPFLIAAAIIVKLFGDDITDWYINLVLF